MLVGESGAGQLRGAVAGDVPGTHPSLSMWKLGVSVEVKFSTASLYQELGNHHHEFQLTLDKKGPGKKEKKT